MPIPTNKGEAIQYLEKHEKFLAKCNNSEQAIDHLMETDPVSAKLISKYFKETKDFNHLKIALDAGLDSYSALIVSRYFKTDKDFKNLEMVSKRFEGNSEKLKYNPVALTSDNIRRLFPNIETQYLYGEPNEKVYTDGKIKKYLIVSDNVFNNARLRKLIENNDQVKIENLRISDNVISKSTDASRSRYPKLSAVLGKPSESLNLPSSASKIDYKSSSKYNTIPLINQGTRDIYPNMEIQRLYGDPKEKLFTDGKITKYLIVSANVFKNANLVKLIENNDKVVKELSILKNVEYNLSANFQSLYPKLSAALEKPVESLNMPSSASEIHSKSSSKYNTIPLIDQETRDLFPNMEIQRLYGVPNEKLFTDGKIKMHAIMSPHAIDPHYRFTANVAQNVKNLILSGHVKRIQDLIIYYKLEKLIINPGVQELCDCAFDMPSLKEVTLPKNIKLGDYCFGGTSLTSVTIPDGCLIHSSVFSDCKKLKDVSFAGDCNLKGRSIFSNSLITSIDLSRCTSTKKLKSTFDGCKHLKKVILPPQLCFLGDETFSDCSALESITIPSSVTHIGKKAFDKCSGLTEITIEKPYVEAYYIDDKTFKGCTKLKTVHGKITDALKQKIENQVGHEIEVKP